MKAQGSFGKTGTAGHTAQREIATYLNLQHHRCESLKYGNIKYVESSSDQVNTVSKQKNMIITSDQVNIVSKHKNVIVTSEGLNTVSKRKNMIITSDLVNTVSKQKNVIIT